MAPSHRILIPVRIPRSCSKFKCHSPSGPRIWQLEKKATIALKGRFGSPVIGMNAVYVRPASWRSSAVLSINELYFLYDKLQGHLPLCAEDSDDVATSHLGNTLQEIFRK
jgi:hypothetical protein